MRRACCRWPLRRLTQVGTRTEGHKGLPVGERDKGLEPLLRVEGGGGHGWRRKHLCRVVVVATQAGGVKTIELRVRGTDA